MKVNIEIDTTNQDNLAEALSFISRYISVKTKMAVKDTEIPLEDTKKVSEGDDKAKAKKPAPRAKKVTITLASLKELAKEVVEISDRESVKAIINEFGEKLTDVAESDYEALVDKLTALKG